MKNDGNNTWQLQLLARVRSAVSEHPFWASCIDRVLTERRGAPTIHLAIFVEPFLRFILDGKKTVDSRFSVHLRPPHRRVHKGDVILLKKSGGAVVGVCQVTAVWFYRLDPASWQTILTEFSQAMCADGSAFWRQRRQASFVTLMKLTRVARLESIECDKRDRRSWVVLRGERHRRGTLF